MLKVENVTKKYITRDVLCNISLSCENPGFLAIVGRSGSGKTTLLNIIAGVAEASSGTVTLGNRSSKDPDWSKYVAYMYPGQSLLPSLTVYDNILFRQSIFKEESKHCVSDIICLLGLEKVKQFKPGKLSSGEYRRAALGSILALDREYYIMDEPTSNLDEITADIIRDCIMDLSKSHGVIVATHDEKLMGGAVFSLGA